MNPHTLTLPKAIVTLLAGALFGLGLAVSTMVQPEVVIGFLRFEDWGLMLVMGAAAGTALIAYRLLPRLMQSPVLGDKFLTQPAHWNCDTALGAALFGVGWGLSGVCPGPAIAALGTGNWDIVWALGGIVLGALVQGWRAK